MNNNNFFNNVNQNVPPQFLGNTPVPRDSITPGHLKNKKKKREFDKKKIINLVIVIQFVVIVLLSYLYFFTDREEILNDDKVINDVSEKITDLPNDESPTVITLRNVEGLKQENAIQAEVYKDAEDGDIALVYTDKLIIYRKDEEKVIYNGETPRTKADRLEQEIISDITAKAKEMNLIPSDYSGIPSISAIQDADKLRLDNPEFYKDAKVGDLLILFDENDTVALYSQESKSIYKSGNISSSIAIR